MPTTPNQKQTQRGAAAPGGRFGRTKPAPASRRPSLRKQSQSQPSSPAKKALSVLTVGKAAKKAAPSAPAPGKKGGFALLAAAGGLAFKNRDKLGGLLGRKKQPPAPPAPPTL